MGFPSDSDFELYDSSLFTNVEWDANFQKIITFWNSGAYDISVGTITATTYNNLPGSSFTITTGESISAGEVVRISGGLLYKATNATSAGVTSVVGISTTTTAAGLTATVSSDYYSSFSGLTVGATYYVGINGAKVTTEPTEYPITIGTAVSATRLNISIQEDKTTVGSIMAYTLGTKPNGTLLADGTLVSRTAHARLFGIIGTTYGAGDGSTTFGLPDFEGEFLRGLDSTRTIGDTQADATAVNGLATVTAGSHHHQMFQPDAVQDHEFTPPTDTGSIGSLFYGDGDSAYSITESAYPTSAPSVGPTGSAGDHTHALTGDTETRPANKSVLYCIKL